MTATSGRRCLEQFGRFSRAGSWVRTFAGFLLMQGAWYSSRCALTWKLSATKCNRLLFQLVPSMPRTGGTGSGLLPTVQTQGMKRCNADGKTEFMPLDLLPTPNVAEGEKYAKTYNPDSQMGKGLTAMAVNGLLPTPTVMEDRRKPNGNPARDAKLLTNLNPYSIRVLYPTPLATDIAHPERVRELKEAGGDTFFSRKNGETRPNGLTDFLDFHGMLPTPTASEWKGGTAKERKDGKSRYSELKHLVARRIGQASQLNPLFVTEMMGYPLDWLISPFRNGGGNPSNASATR